MLGRVIIIFAIACIIFIPTGILLKEFHPYWIYAGFTLALGIFSASINIMRSYFITCPDPDEYFD